MACNGKESGGHSSDRCNLSIGGRTRPGHLRGRSLQQTRCSLHSSCAWSHGTAFGSLKQASSRVLPTRELSNARPAEGLWAHPRRNWRLNLDGTRWSGRAHSGSILCKSSQRIDRVSSLERGLRGGGDKFYENESHSLALEDKATQRQGRPMRMSSCIVHDSSAMVWQKGQ